MIKDEYGADEMVVEGKAVEGKAKSISVCARMPYMIAHAVYDPNFLLLQLTILRFLLSPHFTKEFLLEY